MPSIQGFEYSKIMSSIFWNRLSGIQELEKANDLSFSRPVLLFKHSTRCSISAMALSRLERNYTDSPLEFFYLDLLSYRDISNTIAEKYSVYHQSPQALLIYKGECILDSSHMEIDLHEIMEVASSYLTQDSKN